MCKKYFEEIPSLITNGILILGILIIFALRCFNKFPGDDIQFIQVLALLFGTLVVGNSITLYRSKTVSNELIRSNIDTINHCLTNEKLKIETYNAVLSVKNQAENLKKDDEDNTKELNAEKTKEAKDIADNALKNYIYFCNKLNEKSNSEDPIVKKIFGKCLKHLQDLIKEN
jgi:hypothetical protein